jgi:hypothetical protein
MLARARANDEDRARENEVNYKRRREEGASTAKRGSERGVYDNHAM